MFHLIKIPHQYRVLYKKKKSTVCVKTWYTSRIVDGKTFVSQTRKVLWAAAVAGPIKQGTREVCGILQAFCTFLFFYVIIVSYLYVIFFCFSLILEEKKSVFFLLRKYVLCEKS